MIIIDTAKDLEVWSEGTYDAEDSQIQTTTLANRLWDAGHEAGLKPGDDWSAWLESLSDCKLYVWARGFETMNEGDVDAQNKAHRRGENN